MVRINLINDAVQHLSPYCITLKLKSVYWHLGSNDIFKWNVEVVAHPSFLIRKRRLFMVMFTPNSMALPHKKLIMSDYLKLTSVKVFCDYNNNKTISRW